MTTVPDTSISLAADDGNELSLVANAIHHELYFGGPMTAEVLVAALARQGAELTTADIEDLLDVGDVPNVIGLGFDEQALYVALDGLLAERVFTHRLTVAEIESDVLTVEPDLKPLLALTEWAPFNRFEDGSLVEVFLGAGTDPVESIRLDAGTLAYCQPGDLIGMRVGVAGLRLDAVGDPAEPPADLRTRIHALLEVGGDLQPRMTDELIWELCNDDPVLFTDPLPPLTDLLDSWDLVRSLDHLAPAGLDFDGWGDALRQQELADSYELTEAEASAVQAVSRQFRRVQGLVGKNPGLADQSGGEPADAAGDDGLLLSLPDVPIELADSAVAEAVLWETIGGSVTDAVALGALVESWERHASRRVRPSLAWLRGKCLERLGNVLEAEAAFNETLSLDTSFDNALIDAARYAADRGDAARAILLLERADFTDEDPILAQLRAYLPTDRHDVGRNDPCWCGSGRKYKRCHLGRTDLTSSLRAAWLYSKAVRLCHDAPHSELLFDLAVIRTEFLTTDVLEATKDGTVLDVALFDGGVLAAFLRVRGVLLTEEERQLAGSWLLVTRSVFEVTAVRVGQGVTLRDLRSGHGHDIQDVLFSRSVQIGDLVTTRLLPVDDSVEIYGGVEPVPRDLLDRTLEVLDVEEPNPHAVISVLSARSLPPGMTSTGDWA